MLRNSFTQASRRLAPSSTRFFSLSTRTMAEGDTGAPRSMGGGDAFNKREKANEDMYVRNQELQKLKLLKEKLAAQRQNIDDLEKDISAMMDEPDKK